MYTLIGSLTSRAFRVGWMLSELSQDYELIKEQPKGPQARAANPSGKIPVLMDGDAAVPDSVAILTYLTDKHGAFTHPPGTIERAHQDSLTQFICDEVDGCLWTAMRNKFTNPEDQRSADIEPILKWEFDRSMASLSQRIGDGPWLTGETFTVPDLLLCHCMGWAYHFGFPLAQAEKAMAISNRGRKRDAYGTTVARRDAK
ncbi:MAG: glutathione S-transferase family protein [Pseudomonadota bacterium]